MLRYDDPLLLRPHRVIVAGVSGSGKSTLAQSIAHVGTLPYTELDSLFHGPHWTERPEFMAEVRAFTDEGSWVTEWQYSAARPLLASRADLLVWLDVPFFTATLPQVVTRTMTRRLTRQRLWNGNLEGPLRTFFTDPEHIVRWAWSTRHVYQGLVSDAAAQHPELTVVRLRSHERARQWVEGPLSAVCSGGN